MKVKIVSRSKIKVTRKSRPKYAGLKEAVDQLKPGGDAIRVSYSDKKELNSIRNVVYSYNRKKERPTTKSITNTEKKIIFFFLD